MWKKLYPILLIVPIAGVVIAQQAFPHPEASTKAARFDYVIESKYSFEQTIEELKKASEAEKYAVQGVHEMSKILESKGFPREPLAVLEICNAKAATDSLNQDIRTSLMMPCPLSIYQEGKKVMVAAFDTRAMATMYTGEHMAEVGARVDTSLRKILAAVAAKPEQLSR